MEIKKIYYTWVKKKAHWLVMFSFFLIWRSQINNYKSQTTTIQSCYLSTREQEESVETNQFQGSKTILLYSTGSHNDYMNSAHF